MNSIILTEGGDRYGAHICRYITDYIYFNTLNKEIFVSSIFKYKTRLFFNVFYNLCSPINKKPPKTLFPNNKYGFVGHNLELVKLIKQDIPSYFIQKYKPEFIKYININKFKMRNIICVHLRLDDTANYIPKYDNLKYKCQQVEKHISSNFKSNMDMSILESCTPWIHQHNVDLNKLNSFIVKLQKKYPEYSVEIICSPKGVIQFPKSFDNFKIIRNLNEDDSLLYMIQSKILVLSASTYSYISGLFHEGDKVYYPYWNHYLSFGLNSQYDKSNWKQYNIWE